jgi:Na+-driven multidrug efflux pump
MGSVLRLSGSATVQMLISMTSYIGVMRILSSFGSAPLAGYTIGMRIFMFAILPAFGLSNAAATLVGQNLGAGRVDRAEQSVWRACLFSAMFLSAIGVVFLVGADFLVSLFTQDPDVVPHAVAYLRIVSLGFPFYAYGMGISQSFNGAGDTKTPTFINLFVFYVLQIPLAWALSHHTSLGSHGVFATLGLCFSIFAAIGVVLFRRGAWKKTKI